MSVCLMKSNCYSIFFFDSKLLWIIKWLASNFRSSSVSLEEKMDELVIGGGKMRKTNDMRSEMNLSIACQPQFVGFGMLPDQVYNKAVRKGFEFSLMVVGKWFFCESKAWKFLIRTNLFVAFQEPLDLVSPPWSTPCSLLTSMLLEARRLARTWMEWMLTLTLRLRLLEWRLTTGKDTSRMHMT